jgi:hypothetical protein
MSTGLTDNQARGYKAALHNPRKQKSTLSRSLKAALYPTGLATTCKAKSTRAIILVRPQYAHSFSADSGLQADMMMVYTNPNTPQRAKQQAGET